MGQIRDCDSRRIWASFSFFRHYGDARLPQEPVGADRFADNLRRHFAGISDSAVERHWFALNQMANQAHGRMPVIAPDAASEAKRFELQGIAIDAVPLVLYEIRWTGPRFLPDSRMDESYLID